MKYLFLLLLVLTPLSAMSAQNFQIDFENPAHEKLARQLANDLTLATPEKKIFSLRLISPPLAQLEIFEHHFIISEYQTNINIAYIKKENKQKNTITFNASASVKKISRECVEKLLETKLPAPQQKILFIHQYPVTPDFFVSTLYNHLEKKLNFSKSVDFNKAFYKTGDLIDTKPDDFQGLVYFSAAPAKDSFDLTIEIKKRNAMLPLLKKTVNLQLGTHFEVKINQLSDELLAIILENFEPETQLTQVVYDKIQIQPKSTYQKPNPDNFYVEKTHNFFAGLSFVLNEKAQYPNKQKNDLRSAIGLSLLGERRFLSYFSAGLKLNYAPFQQKSPILDASGFNYGDITASHRIDFLPAAFIYWKKIEKTDFFRAGFTLQPGLHFAKIGITPSSQSTWPEDAIKSQFFVGYKIAAGLFFETSYYWKDLNLTLPLYLEILYQLGKTDLITHNSLVINLLIKAYSF